MNKKFFCNKSIMILLTMTLIMAFTLVGCQRQKETMPKAEENTKTEEVTVLGEGEKQFTFKVVDKEGNVTAFEIHTNKEMVGDALLEHSLITGQGGEFGLFVKSVNGITADYNVDQTYWAFYINNEYATTGVDMTPITEGDVYTFKVEK